MDDPRDGVGVQPLLVDAHGSMAAGRIQGGVLKAVPAAEVAGRAGEHGQRERRRSEWPVGPMLAEEPVGLRADRAVRADLGGAQQRPGLVADEPPSALAPDEAGRIDSVEAGTDHLGSFGPTVCVTTHPNWIPLGASSALGATTSSPLSAPNWMPPAPDGRQRTRAGRRRGRYAATSIVRRARCRAPADTTRAGHRWPRLAGPHTSFGRAADPLECRPRRRRRARPGSRFRPGRDGTASKP